MLIPIGHEDVYKRQVAAREYMKIYEKITAAHHAAV